MKTAFQASKLAIAVFIVPYMFAYSPSMLMIGDEVTWLMVAQIAVTAAVGIFGVTAAIEGYLFKHMEVYIRIIMAVGGLMLIHPGRTTDLIGISLVVVCVVIQYILGKKQGDELPAEGNTTNEDATNANATNKNVNKQILENTEGYED